jgi:hypothetical protein
MFTTEIIFILRTKVLFTQKHHDLDNPISSNQLVIGCAVAVLLVTIGATNDTATAHLHLQNMNRFRF